jgi:hypothetical protein
MKFENKLEYWVKKTFEKNFKLTNSKTKEYSNLFVKLIVLHGVVAD